MNPYTLDEKDCNGDLEGCQRIAPYLLDKKGDRGIIRVPQIGFLDLRLEPQALDGLDSV